MALHNNVRRKKTRQNHSNKYIFKSDGQVISTIECQELKNHLISLFVHKQLLGR